MAPASRKQPTRSAPISAPSRPSASSHPQLSAAELDREGRYRDPLADFRARRLQRKLDELERTNPTDIPASSFVPAVAQPTVPGQPGFAAQQNKKKQAPNVRKVLLARKSLADWLGELPADPRPPYLLATAPPPRTPARNLCASCGYTGKYRCEKCAEWSCSLECRTAHEAEGGCGVGR